MNFFETLIHGIIIAVIVVVASIAVKKSIKLLEESIIVDYIQVSQKIKKSFKRGFEQVIVSDLNHYPITFKKKAKRYNVRKNIGSYIITKKEEQHGKEHASN